MENDQIPQGDSSRPVHPFYQRNSGEGIGLPFPPAKAIFAGIGVLLAAIKDVSASYDALVDLFESTELFLRRLDIYTKIPSTPAMNEIIVKILVEVLSTLALATQQVKEGRLKKFGKKLLGENDIEAVVQRLDRLTHEEARTTAAQTLEVVYGLFKTMKVVMDDGKASVEGMQKALTTEDFRSWLSPPDPSKNHNIARKSHHDGTASWFIHGNTFPEWRATGSLLWVHGKPGSGKSVLCSALIHEITKMQEAGLACLAYYYFDFRDTAKQDTRGFLTSLLIQLSAQSDSCSHILSRLYSIHDAGSKQPSDDSLAECLEDMLALSGQGPIYIIADGLDECPRGTGTPSPRESVLEIVKGLVKLGYPNVHISVTSRPEADIEGILKPLASHSVSLHDESGQTEDINSYINSFINSDTKTRQWRKEDKELVINKLCEEADGMFRWVYCQLDKLRRCLPGRIRRALEELPGTLDETYERTLQDIDDENWAYAHRLLQCVTVASRPFRVEELAEFLAFDFKEGESARFEADWRPENAGMLFSLPAREFLTSERLARGRISRYYIPLEPAHLIVAQACLAVLLELNGHIETHSIEDFRLAYYAGKHWVDHAKFGNVALYMDDGMKEVFDPDGPHFAMWIWIKDKDTKGKEGMILERPSQPRRGPLSFAAENDFSGVAEWLITMRSQDVNSMNGGHWNSAPLYTASMQNCVNVAKVLLKYGADVNVRGSAEWTLLHETANKGHLEISQLLIKSGADVNAKSLGGSNPMLLASAVGHKDIVQLLLEHGADTNAWYGDKSVLYWALKGGHLKVAQLLLKHSADVNARNEKGQTLLHVASQHGDLDVARRLLERGGDVNARNNQGKTPFEAASEKGHREIAELLLK
ncbi:hypothetical protein B0F90DRAFT_1822487 [Multifurca ochricompacta]|uniref:NACHT domain-containing protein n=1 Tax=Multifurca ochricompacta TaxID=376703 RepID=A0AAD4LYK0_9AGAM|nr:hypothetical protein B0F90DRAFT_1822487 [Multifurca ochricompacta]